MPQTIEELLEKSTKSKNGIVIRRTMPGVPLAESPAVAMLEFLESIAHVDSLDKSADNSEFSENEEDLIEEGEGWERQVVAIGPKFTFRNPEVSASVLKDFKRMGFLDTKFKKLLPRPPPVVKKEDAGQCEEGTQGGFGSSSKKDGGNAADGGLSPNSLNGDGLRLSGSKNGFVFHPQHRLGTLSEN